MNNKKIYTGVGIILIVIITVSIGIFVWKCEKKKLTEFNPQTANQAGVSTGEKTFKISDNWTLVSHYNFWNNPNVFKTTPYNFANIKFSYPENWEFQCCNDMDHASTHTIYSSKNRDKSLPYIQITDYVLSGCPISQKKCSMDKLIKISASEKFNQLISDIPKTSILPKIKLNNLNDTAFVFNKSEEDGKISKSYLINPGNDVIEIDFVNYEILGDKFIDNFLNRISPDIK